MRKLLLIILLIVGICIIDSNIAFTKVKFRNWDKWDQQLPDMNNKYWSWTFPGEKSTISTIEGQLILITTYLYFGTSKNRASVIFYSPASQKTNIKKDYIPSPKFALVCFPSEKKKSIVRAYEIRNIEEGLSQFIEEWEISFKNRQVVVPKDAKFRKLFKEWLEKQVSLERPLPDSEELTDKLLPELTIWEKKYFRISDGTKSIYK